jgi:LacI family transcriptional regulator
MKRLSIRKRPNDLRVTLSDVAQRVGTSVVTVSRALNGSPLVAESTTKRILEASAELGYIPNLLARGLVTDRTATVGVIIPELANPFFAPMVSGVEAVAAKREFLVVVGESRRTARDERRCVEQYQQFRIGGIIITPVTDELDHVMSARAAGTPVVVMARRWEQGDYVSTDDVEGGRLAADHFLKWGHRRIALIRRGDPRHTPVQATVQGFREMLGSVGVSIPETWDLQMPEGQIRDGIAAASRLLEQEALPSAVFVTSDRMALGVVHRLLERAVRVPEDVAVIGYDDIPYAETSRVPLTTIAVPKRLVGELAAEILFERYDGIGPAEPRQILLPPELVLRASCP